MRPLSVSTPHARYPICFSASTVCDWRGLAKTLKQRFPKNQVGIVTSPAVAAHYLENLIHAFNEMDLIHHSFLIPDGEAHKTLRTVERLYGELIAKGMGRSDPLVALGGGVIGDMTGFAAATYLRGVPYVQVPTTLLAQVDSSVGGKTGVDHRLGKNLIGAFYQPQLVWIDLATLTTLPNRQIRAGFAEIVKYGAIADKRLFDAVARLSKKEIEHDRFLTSSELSHIIRRSCDIKARIVNVDEKETLGIRSLLNFGHTVGHAIEAASTYESYLHGEAIAIGMVIAARASARLGLCESHVVEALQSCLERLGLAAELPPAMKKKLSPRTLIQYIARDKKKRGSKIQFVVLERLGKAGLKSLELDRLGELLKGCL